VNEAVTSTKILAALTADSSLKDSNINVTTSNGVVTLGGTVNSRDQVALATDIAQRQEGVSRVESNIEVR
jgi:hyperosmotically inducible protein